MAFEMESSPEVIHLIIGTFSIRFFVGNGKPQTAKCHVTTTLRTRLQFAVHVCTAGRAFECQQLAQN